MGLPNQSAKPDGWSLISRLTFLVRRLVRPYVVNLTALVKKLSEETICEKYKGNSMLLRFLFIYNSLLTHSLHVNNITPWWDYKYKYSTLVTKILHQIIYLIDNWNTPANYYIYALDVKKNIAAKFLHSTRLPFHRSE